MRVIFAAAAAAASTDPAANWNNYFHETFNNKSSLRTAAAEKQARNLSMAKLNFKDELLRMFNHVRVA